MEKNLTTGSVSIGASETALNIFLLDKLKKFHIKYPGIRLKIYNHSTPQAIEAVRSGIIDFAVASSPVLLERTAGSQVASVIYRSQIAL